MNSETCHVVDGSEEIINIINETSNETNIPIVKGTILCNEFFDPYIEDIQKLSCRRMETITFSVWLRFPSAVPEGSQPWPAFHARH